MSLLATLPQTERPRERCLAAGAGALSERELLAVLLGRGGRGRPVLELAESLLAEHGGLCGLAGLSGAQWMRERGIGQAQAARLLAAAEWARRLARATAVEGAPLADPEIVDALMRPRLAQLAVETFHVLLLDVKHRLIEDLEVVRGTLDRALVHPREVFRPAVQRGAAAVILVHNHPSGDPEPSTQDVQLTQRLEEVGRVVGIPVLDHVVVARGGFASLSRWMASSPA